MMVGFDESDTLSHSQAPPLFRQHELRRLSRCGRSDLPQAVRLSIAGYSATVINRCCYNELKSFVMATQVQSSHFTTADVTILARFLSNGDDPLPKNVARYILHLSISEQDRARMHDLAVRNQDDDLTPEEKEQMYAFGRAATLLSILKSKARRALGVKLKTRTGS
jgi:hypothetical protein